MAASNVIPFKRKINPIQEPKISYKEELIYDIIIEMVEILYEEGYDFFDKDEYFCEMSLLAESMKSLLNRYDDEPHPFQEVAKNLFSYIEDEDEDKQLTFDF
jgi:hypothetical protein